jgi:hypothetical protein
MIILLIEANASRALLEILGAVGVLDVTHRL